MSAGSLSAPYAQLSLLFLSQPEVGEKKRQGTGKYGDSNKDRERTRKGQVPKSGLESTRGHSSDCIAEGDRRTQELGRWPQKVRWGWSKPVTTLPPEERARAAGLLLSATQGSW